MGSSSVHESGGVPCRTEKFGQPGSRRNQPVPQTVSPAKAALEIWARFRIRSLFITGNAETALSSRAAPANAAGVISKPYRDQDVLNTIGQALTTGQA
jgi:CheY-like chemotaxis protein